MALIPVACYLVNAHPRRAEAVFITQGEANFFEMDFFGFVPERLRVDQQTVEVEDDGLGFQWFTSSQESSARFYPVKGSVR
jgi:hypothetical protein